MQKAKKNISFLFITIFMLMKIVGLHSFKHFDEHFEEYCETCEYVITTNYTPLITDNSESFQTPNIHVFNNRVINSFYFFVVSNNNINNSLLSRPPPAA